MNKILLLFCMIGYFQSCISGEMKAKSSSDSLITQPLEYMERIPKGAQILMDVYPDQIKGYSNGMILIINGDKIQYDDKKEKGIIEMLDNSDIEDMFCMQYNMNGTPEYLSDAGRSRCEQLFKAMYGRCESEARKRLVQVEWFGKSIPFTSVNGAADSLRIVAHRLKQMPQYSKYLTNASTFYWRKVRGANRQSAHSYGIAIDVNTQYSNYWLWEYKGAKETDRIGYTNRIPEEIVRVFEEHGFIWGGRWYHFDTMHFEFRPELLR